MKNYNAFITEISKYDNDWVDYLPRTGWSNNREGMLLMGPKGYSHTEGLSMPEIAKDLDNDGICDDKDDRYDTPSYGEAISIGQGVEFACSTTGRPHNTSTDPEMLALAWVSPLLFIQADEAKH